MYKYFKNNFGSTRHSLGYVDIFIIHLNFA